MAGATFWIVACLAVQGCTSVETASGDGAVDMSVDAYAGGIPQLPVFQTAAVSVEQPPPPKPKPRKTVKRPRPKPATEEARAAATEPPGGEDDPAGAAADRERVPDQRGQPKLVGLSEEELVAALGNPTEREEQLPGKLWRYRLPGCTLTVSLYPEVQTMVFRSLSYEVTRNDVATDDPRSCLSPGNLSLVAK